MKLYNYVNNKIKDNDMYCVFLDEVQNVYEFEKAVDGLYIKKNLDEYITGSNAYLLSGRYIEFKMFPLSLKEYANYYKQDGDEKLYSKYINNSSLPYALKLESQDEVDK